MINESGFADPDRNVQELNLTGSSVVADLGAGSGFYTLAIARRLAEEGGGIVYAIDVQKSYLSHIQDAAAKAGLGNVRVLWGDIEHPGGVGLANSLVTHLVISNTLFQVEDRTALFREAARLAAPGAELLLIDWSGSFGSMGPDPSHIIDEETAVREASSLGFNLTRSFNAGAHHWGVLMKKS